MPLDLDKTTDYDCPYCGKSKLAPKRDSNRKLTMINGLSPEHRTYHETAHEGDETEVHAFALVLECTNPECGMVTVAVGRLDAIPDYSGIVETNVTPRFNPGRRDLAILRSFWSGSADVLWPPFTTNPPAALRERMEELLRDPLSADPTERAARGLCRLYRHLRRTCTLLLNPGTPFAGVATFEQGVLAHAEMGPLRGEEALREMLWFEDGTWRVEGEPLLGTGTRMAPSPSAGDRRRERAGPLGLHRPAPLRNRGGHRSPAHPGGSARGARRAGRSRGEFNGRGGAARRRRGASRHAGLPALRAGGGRRRGISARLFRVELRAAGFEVELLGRRAGGASSAPSRDAYGPRARRHRHAAAGWLGDAAAVQGGSSARGRSRWSSSPATTTTARRLRAARSGAHDYLPKTLALEQVWRSSGWWSSSPG